jgi:phosphonate transport system permease protein
MTRSFPSARAAIAVVLALAVIALWDVGLLDLGDWSRAVSNLAEFTGELFPPDTDSVGTLAEAMIETIEIAFIGTLLGLVLSVPLAVLGTRTIFGPAITVPARLFIGVLRTVPSLLWGVIFVIGFGLGPAAGTMGVALYTVGYLGKLYYESFESVDPEVLEAVKATGASRPQLIVYAVLPESVNSIVSQLLFMFEYNIRASSIMGFVGAGGIGFYMLGYIQLLQYEKLMTALLVTFVVVMAVDYLSARLRSLLVPGMRPSVSRAPLLAGITAAWR